MTRDWLRWADWLTEARLTPVARERPGADWTLVDHLLADPWTVLLVPATQGQNVPGRHPDQADAR